METRIGTEPQWLRWARELQAIAQTGLAYEPGPYDRERYDRLRSLASEMMAAGGEGGAWTTERVESLFRGEAGYATPKVDVRCAVFDPDRRILMVRETADAGRWTLPGGWADVNLTAAENAVREVREESGYETRVCRLAAVWDRTRQGHAPKVFSCVKLFFLGEVAGGEARGSTETSEVHWFAEADLPMDELSRERVLPHQLRRMFEHWRNPSLPTDWE